VLSEPLASRDDKIKASAEERSRAAQQRKRAIWRGRGAAGWLRRRSREQVLSILFWASYSCGMQLCTVYWI
jgi:hypothetical protein